MAFVADSFVANGSVTSLTGPAVTVSGSNRIALLGVYCEGGVTVSSIALGAHTPTFITGSSPFNPYGDFFGVYQVLNPTAGSPVPSVTFSGTSSRCCLYTLTEDGITAIGTPSTNWVDGTDLQIDATSTSGQRMIAMVAVGQGTLTMAGTGQTSLELQQDFASVNRSFAAASKTAAGATTNFAYTNGTTDGYIVAIPLTVAAGGSSTLARAVGSKLTRSPLVRA